jgi:hypothetical protein
MHPSSTVYFLIESNRPQCRQQEPEKPVRAGNQAPEDAHGPHDHQRIGKGLVRDEGLDLMVDPQLL